MIKKTKIENEGAKMFSANTKFLVVDDFSTMRKIIKKMLVEMGFSLIVEAVDGKNALEQIEVAKAENKPFDCIISDWNMPVMSGIDLLKTCKTDPILKNLPFILVTAESEQAQILEALKTGVSDYMIKPFNANTFKEKLQKTYARHQVSKVA